LARVFNLGFPGLEISLFPETSLRTKSIVGYVQANPSLLRREVCFFSLYIMLKCVGDCR